MNSIQPGGRRATFLCCALAWWVSRTVPVIVYDRRTGANAAPRFH